MNLRTILAKFQLASLIITSSVTFLSQKDFALENEDLKTPSSRFFCPHSLTSSEEGLENPRRSHTGQEMMDCPNLSRGREMHCTNGEKPRK